ncbi:unnamed protein product [Lampetra planeri]
MAEGGPVLDRVLQFLLAQGGRVRDGELTERFRGFLEEGDPAKRAERCAEWKAALKACAVVKQDKGARFLVLKKKFRHLLGGDAAAGTHGSGGGGGEEEGERGGSSLTVEAQPHVHDGEEGEQQQQQQQEEEVKKMDEEEEEAGTSGDGAEPLEVEGRGKEVEEAMEVEEKQEVEEVDKEEDVVEAQEMCEQEAPAESRGADPEASLSSSSEGGRVEDGGGEDARGPPIGGHEPVSASSETISEQSEQLQSMCSRAETEQEDMGSITASSVTLEPLERKWMRGAAVGCADTLRQLLAQDPSLASHRDFTSLRLWQQQQHHHHGRHHHQHLPLHWAAKHGSVETATLVAEAGVDVNARSWTGGERRERGLVRGGRGGPRVMARLNRSRQPETKSRANNAPRAVGAGERAPGAGGGGRSAKRGGRRGLLG